MKPNLAKVLVVLSALVLMLSACGRGEPAGSEPESSGAPPAVSTPDQSNVSPEPTEEDIQDIQPEPWTWPQDTPEDHGMRSELLDALHGELDGTNVLAMVVAKDGAIVDEYYKDGYDETSSFQLYSCSKSVTSALIGIAIDQGYIDGVDVLVSDYFPQILETDGHPWRDVTLWNLLTHTTGVQTTDSALWEPWHQSENWVDYVLELPRTAEIGTTFDYSTGNTHLLSAILQKATGMTAYEYGKEVLFDPMGMDSVQCGLDPQGISDGGNAFFMNVYDMAKFGQLYLNGGVWEGQQLLPAGWVEESTTLQFDRSTGSADYGYQWWVRTFGAERYPAFFAQGHFGQYIFVVPQLELVAVFTSYHTGSSSMYWQFANEIVAACDVL